MAKAPSDSTRAEDARNDSNPSAPSAKDSLTTGGVARSAKLASIPLSAMGRTAVGFGRQMIGQSGELVSKEMQAKTAE